MTNEQLLAIGILALAITSLLGQLTVWKLRKQLDTLFEYYWSLDDELTFTRKSLNRLEVVVKSLATKRGK